VISGVNTLSSVRGFRKMGVLRCGTSNRRFRGGDDIGSMRQRIEFDLEYLQHWSLTLDLMIIIKTALVVWNDRHAY